MYSKARLIQKYISWYCTASNSKGHGTHSPFIFSFITKVLNDKTAYADYNSIELLRKQLRNDHTVLTIEDFGAGSITDKSNLRTISSIAKSAAKPKKFGQLLFRMVKYYEPRTILELGTSLGITSSYLSLGNPAAMVTTMEGATEVAAVARKNFTALGLQNISVMEGNFDDILAPVAQDLGSVDCCFIDGNHRREPTERYFQQLLPITHNDSILIFDDIHWSPEMEKAWGTIRNHPAVRCSVDLFFIGIVFFREEFHEKQHFSIRF